jgi:N-acyl-L-homoserine lactone synthetase
MICIINASNRCGFEKELAEMHRLRALAIADEASWRLAAVEDRDVDVYDRPDATYLLAKQDSRGAVLAAVRLLPTDRPHPMRDAFAEGCLGPMPGGSTVWEISRFCMHPDIRRRRDRTVLLHHMTCAVMETALLFGIEAVILVASGALLRYVLSCGWTATVLGPTLHFPTADVTAVQALITPEGLRSARLRFHLGGPVTRFPIASRIAA